MSAEQPTIIYTLTDEAPLLATYALPADHPGLHRAGRHRRRDQRHLAWPRASWPSSRTT